MAEKNIPAIVKAFEDFSIFCKMRWRAAILGILFIAILSALFLFVYFCYRKIEMLGTNVVKSIDILEKTNSTPASLQEGLIDSVSKNLLIEQELTHSLLFSRNALTAIFFKFHNSKTDLQGKHDFFYSAMNEVSKERGVTFLSNEQNIPITELGQYMVPFMEHKCQTFATDDIVNNSWLKMKLEKYDIIRISACPIYDYTDKYIIGFVELVYGSENDQVRTPEEVEKCLYDTATRLSNILSF